MLLYTIHDSFILLLLDFDNNSIGTEHVILTSSVKAALL